MNEERTRKWGDPVRMGDQVRIIKVRKHGQNVDLEGSLALIIGLTEDTISLRSLIEGHDNHAFLYRLGEVEVERV